MKLRKNNSIDENQVQEHARKEEGSLSRGRRALRQNLLILYLGNSNLDSAVIGWSVYEGTGTGALTTGENGKAPYHTGLEALRDGWRVISYPSIPQPFPGHEYETSYLKFEFVFEKLEEIDVT